MQENKYYDLPDNSKIDTIKYSDGGFSAFDKNGNKLFTIVAYDNGPDYVSDECIRITAGDKIGFANLRGEIIIEPRFDAALPFSDGLAGVCRGCVDEKIGEHTEIKGGTWGFVDKSGKLVIPYQYDRIIESFSNGTALIERNGKQTYINTKGAPVNENAKNYNGWIKLLCDEMKLISSVCFSDDFKITVTEQKNGDYIFPVEKQTSFSIVLSAKEDRQELMSFELIPWTDFTLNRGKKGQVDLSLTKDLVAVTDYAVIYKSLQQRNDENDSIKNFEEIFKDVINFPGLWSLQEEELNYPDNISFISAEVYNNHVELQVALPGSILPPKEVWRKVCKDRMLHLHLVPDTGEIKSSWIKTESDIMNVYYSSVEEDLLATFRYSLDLALKYPGDRVEVYNEGKNKLRRVFNAANSYVNLLYDQYENRLRRWLIIDETENVSPSTENIFGDYSPKTTPDTMIDYMPRLESEISRLPDPSPNNLVELLTLFNDYKLETAKNPGEWEEGNIVLGAREEEYKPSKEELVLSEVGGRIRSIIIQTPRSELTKIIKKHGIPFIIIEYKSFSFTHADVMGSGRFFYVDDIDTVLVEIDGTRE